MEWKEANEYLNKIKKAIQENHKKSFVHLAKQREYFLDAFRGDNSSQDDFINTIAQGIQHFNL
jgi:hypothetical protein